MKKNLVIFLAFAFALMAVQGASATYTSVPEPVNSVKSIVLSGTDKNISWKTDGYSASGFKITWSKNEQPTYPLRSGDQYHYYGESTASSDVLTPFNGDGYYFVRVCEYLGGKCGLYSNQIKVLLAGSGKVETPVACTMDYNPVCGYDGKTYANKCMATSQKGVKIAYAGECKAGNEIKNFEQQSKSLSENKMDDILRELKELRSLVKEQQTELKYLRSLFVGMGQITASAQKAINGFVTYGVDDNTKLLGAGERAAVMNSYKKAFKKLPENEQEMTDAIKIANGRWPSKKSSEAETLAKAMFIKIYEREAVATNPNDNAAVTIMAYGLRQKAINRNLESEKNAIVIFEGIFGHTPSTTDEWNAMQAIAYSGAKK